MGTILDYLGLSRTNLTLYRARVQVEAGESKLLLLETFSFFFFFTLASSREARAPKNFESGYVKIIFPSMLQLLYIVNFR